MNDEWPIRYERLMKDSRSGPVKAVRPAKKTPTRAQRLWSADDLAAHSAPACEGKPCEWGGLGVSSDNPVDLEGVGWRDAKTGYSPRRPRKPAPCSMGAGRVAPPAESGAGAERGDQAAPAPEKMMARKYGAEIPIVRVGALPRRRACAASSIGDPAPGRSALDQRNRGQ